MLMTTVDLEAIARAYTRKAETCARRITICAGTGCVAGGSLDVHRAFVRELQARGLDIETVLDVHEDDPDDQDKTCAALVTKSGCQGFCQMGPLVTIEPDSLLYVRVRPEDVPEIVRESILLHEPVERLLYRDPKDGRPCRNHTEIAFYNRQQRTVLRECGALDPENIAEYIAHGGYEAARRACLESTPEQICRDIVASGLRGRGGGGFPTGRKWDLTRQNPGDAKYVICNGDEGDPGAFMDRSVMEGNPHAVLEGMMIAGRAVGASEGIVYVRAEYPLAVERVRRAIADAERHGVLGDDVFGSGWDFRIQVMLGAGAFVCGEETAMISSIEGKRGMPAPKPPFPAQQGLYGMPTVINNVETLASVPLILRKGPESFTAVGTPNSPGTKTFALTGHVMNTGLIEVPFGTTLREIIFNIGGGVTDDAGMPREDGFKAVQIGGPSGGCLTSEHLDLPLDFDSLKGVGAMIGSGGLVVMNRHTCMVSVARFFMQFTQNESCGKCVPCREGTKQMLALLDDITEGRATAETLALLERLAITVGRASLCGLGKTAPNPVLSTMKQFREEYEAHVFAKKCPAGQCKALADYWIDPEQCTGCGRCRQACPMEAIAGAPHRPHTIDAQLCSKCGACMTACNMRAIARR